MPARAAAAASSDEEDEYKVEAILQKRRQGGKTQYLIKWEGYESEDNTWEPIEHLDGAAELLARFNEERSGEAGRKRAREAPSGENCAVGLGRPARTKKQKKKDKERKERGGGAGGSASAASSSAGSQSQQPASATGGIALPPGWRYKRMPRAAGSSASEWAWVDPKAHVYRNADSAAAAVARWEQRLAAGSDASARPARARLD